MKFGVSIPEDEYLAGLEASRKNLHGRILLSKGNNLIKKRNDLSFYVYIDYERLPSFCSFCKLIGHSNDNCRKNDNGPSNAGKKNQSLIGKNNPVVKKTSVPKGTVMNEKVIDVEDHVDQHQKDPISDSHKADNGVAQVGKVTHADKPDHLEKTVDSTILLIEDERDVNAFRGIHNEPINQGNACGNPLLGFDEPRNLEADPKVDNVLYKIISALDKGKNLVEECSYNSDSVDVISVHSINNDNVVTPGEIAPETSSSQLNNSKDSISVTPIP